MGQPRRDGSPVGTQLAISQAQVCTLYALAPEHPYPQGLEQGLAVYQALATLWRRRAGA